MNKKTQFKVQTKIDMNQNQIKIQNNWLWWIPNSAFPKHNNNSNQPNSQTNLIDPYINKKPIFNKNKYQRSKSNQ
jgi:hypothetical protein